MEAGVGISMDGRERWLDNVFIERLICILKEHEAGCRSRTCVASTG
ncbi:hypothetical protein GGQ86_004034 [Xanthobacter flavus]|uniref:Transposase n=1 Tax=Xanthobacter flavus TaxID=281 RepID=A0ABU1KLQ4_XANFL|nr:hypothetical protein [Xanthobacter flavus]